MHIFLLTGTNEEAPPKKGTNEEDKEKGTNEEDKEELMSEMNFEDKFGKSSIFVNSTLAEQGGVPSSSTQPALLKEAIQVMSASYEDRTMWGYEVLLLLFLCQ